jgi:hypothetical protein
MTTSRYIVSTKAVRAFRKRHAAELAPVIQKTEQAVIDLAIADKRARLEAKQARYQLLEQLRRARAAAPAPGKGGYGWETGLLLHKVKWVGAEGGEKVDEWELDKPLLREFSLLEREAAEEDRLQERASREARARGAALQR